METAESEKSPSSEETSQLSRNRSFKTKQLVRSQAIRESQSPPRTGSPSVVVDTAAVIEDGARDVSSKSSSDGRCSDVEGGAKRQPVEIQITPGAWDEPNSDQRNRTKRWLGNKQHSRDLLSNNPRVACVCGACAACVHCRGRRRKPPCPTKQDSGIVCSDDCPDCSDTEASGGSNDGAKTSQDMEEQTYCRCPERKEKPKSLSLSRTDSDERTEPTGPELVNFIKETLNKNARDRLTLLKIEKELHALVNDTGRCIVRFPVMTSYGRMLVHRCATLFQLSHHLDQANKTCVLVSKSGTSQGRIPCTSFKQWCTVNFPPSPQRHHTDNTNAKSILKRDTQSLDEPGTGALSAARSKSLEQREKDYERVRRKIFSSDNCSQDESSQWQWLNSGNVKLLTPEGRNKLLKVQSLEGSGPPSTNKNGNARGPVSKSHSFGGYARSNDPPRLLSRQGDLASSSWRLSPSSSGYRTLSLHSTDSVTPSPTGGASPEPASGTEGVAVMWAVTDYSSVPAGAIVIHPQTGRPLLNPDGTVYHFDPANPPVLDGNAYTHVEQKIDTHNEKKRGRLEKQHSFMDNDCECQPSDESRSKCCCEHRRQETSHTSTTDKVLTTQSEQKNHQKPTSPCKNRYEQQSEATNHNPPLELPTNHGPAYEMTTNHKPIPDNPPNQRPYEVAQSFNPNIRPGFEMRTLYETNQRQDRVFENQRPPSFDGIHKFDPTNPRGAVDSANHRAMKLPTHGTPEVQYVAHQYQQGFPHEEVTSPPQAGPPQYQQEMALKALPLQDHNMRPMSLGVVYPNMGQYYGSPIPVYQPMPPEEQKQSPHTNNTFTIDPSYPYALEYAGGACGACVDPPPAAAPPAAPARPYALYAPVEPILQYHYPYQEPLQWQNIQPVVPVASAPAPKLYMPELYPIAQYPQPMYPQYNVMYPHVIPQPYPVYQPVHPLVEKSVEQRRNSVTGSYRHSKRNSLSGSSRNTPLTTTPEDKKVPYEDSQNAQSAPQHNHNQSQNAQGQNQNHGGQNQNLAIQNTNVVQNTNVPIQQSSGRDSTELAAKIKQINEQMSQLNTRERERDNKSGNYYRRDEWKRRNSGNGILGSYPAPLNGRLPHRPGNDETQLSSAARAIVNSIRNMQAKNNYQDRRPEYNQHAQYRNDRGDKPEYRHRRPDKDRADTDRRQLPIYTPTYLLRQMSPGTWCRRSPGPIHPVLNNPRRPHPDTRGGRR